MCTVVAEDRFTVGVWHMNVACSSSGATAHFSPKSDLKDLGGGERHQISVWAP